MESSFLPVRRRNVEAQTNGLPLQYYTTCDRIATLLLGNSTQAAAVHTSQNSPHSSVPSSPFKRSLPDPPDTESITLMLQQSRSSRSLSEHDSTQLLKSTDRSGRERNQHRTNGRGGSLKTRGSGSGGSDGVDLEAAYKMMLTRVENRLASERAESESKRQRHMNY